MAKIFFDLDGPILDNRTKYHRIYSDLLKGFSIRLLDEERYWHTKRNKTPERKILEGLADDAWISEYEKKRLTNIESLDYLEMDRLQPGIIATLSRWKTRHRIFLVTMRRNRNTLMQQLQRFQLSRFFEDIFNEDNNAGDWRIKESLISSEISDPSECVIIGDTEADIETGKKLGICTVAVTCGIRSHEFLALLQPDFIFEFVKDVDIDLLLRK